MKALLLSAGFGKRLRPLTYKKPKPLVPIVNVPILERNISFLKKQGIKELLINTHYLHKQIEEFLKSKSFQLRVSTIFEPDLLGTGGAIKNAGFFWDNDPFVVMNADIITNINLKEVYKWHVKENALVTIVLHRYHKHKKIILDEKSEIIHIARDELKDGLAFTGIHIISPDLLKYMPNGAFDIIEFYRELIKKGLSIKGYVADDCYWRDIGTLKDYIHANRDLLGKSTFVIGEGSFVHPKAHFSNWAIIGKGCVIEEGTFVSGSVIWDNVIVKRGTSVLNSVLIE